MNSELISRATQNVRDILEYSIKFDPSLNRALVIFDTQDDLTNILTSAYRNALPNAQFLDFDSVTKDVILDIFAQYSPQDLIVMIQTSSFRLDDFRIRINLFKQGLKVIEHLHLYRNEPNTWESYIDSIGYDKNWYGTMGPKLKDILSNANQLCIKTQNNDQFAELNVPCGVEIPKLNTGDYTGMDNVGGTFPIGEVFTEAKVLESVNGSFWVYAFADAKFEIKMLNPFEVKITNGLVTGYSDNAPAEFLDVLSKIKEIERPIIREIGFGLNLAMTRENPLGDITAFERIIGIHLSLGEKHSVYKKEGISAHKARFHVDLFLQMDQVLVDDTVIFENGKYTI